MATILIAEDEARLSSLLVRAMTRDGYQTLAVSSGDVALEQLLNGACDLCLLDLMLPIADGMTVLEQVRAQGVVVPIVVLSALTDRETQAACLQLGANRFIAKPFKIADLRQCVRVLLDEASA